MTSSRSSASSYRARLCIYLLWSDHRDCCSRKGGRYSECGIHLVGQEARSFPVGS
jgi:hypothetical protein